MKREESRRPIKPGDYRGQGGNNVAGYGIKHGDTYAGQSSGTAKT